MQESMRPTSSHGSSPGNMGQALSQEEEDRLAHLRQVAEEDSTFWPILKIFCVVDPFVGFHVPLLR